MIDPMSYGAKGDGATDDTAAVQRAFDALPADGGVVVLNKTYAVTGVNITGKTCPVVRAEQNGGLRALAVPAQHNSTFGAVMLLLQNCSQALIEGLHLDCNQIATGALGVQGCKDSVVSDNLLENAASGGIAALLSVCGGYRNSYVRNTVRNSQNDVRGMWIGNSNTVEIERNPRVEYNLIYNTCTAIGIGNNGGYVSHNRGFDIRGAGCAIYRPPAEGTGLMVNHNHFERCQYQGIQSDSVVYPLRTENVLIEDNICDNNVHTGIYAIHTNGWVVRNNKCRGNKNHGINIGAATDFLVTGNYCEGNENGITAEMGVDPPAAYADWGICNNVRIINNDCMRNVWNGIVGRAMGTIVMSGLVIDYNRLTGNPQAPYYLIGPMRNLRVGQNFMDGKPIDKHTDVH